MVGSIYDVDGRLLVIGRIRMDGWQGRYVCGVGDGVVIEYRRSCGLGLRLGVG